MTVTKRNGTHVAFDKSKISSAIMKAFNEVGTESSVAEKVSSEIASEIESMARDFTVEEIQDEVEKRLMNRRRYKVARAYMNYRYLHSIAREQYGALMDAVSEKLSASNVVNQNANVDEQSFGGRLGEASSVVAKKFALERCVSKMARENHERNEIYIHDLDSYAVGSHNCYMRDTRFITDCGIKTFGDFRDGDKVKVIAMDGKWKDATVHFYGRQPMYEISLSRCGITKTVVATRNHRWLLSNGEFTDNLQIGDSLYPLQEMERPSVMTRRQAEMFALGFILGDGYDHAGVLEAKFCTGEKEECLSIFNMAGYHISMSNGYKYAFKKSSFTKQDFLNNKMWSVLSFDDKRFLFDGYLKADGPKTTNTKYVWTSDKRMCSMIEDISAIDGYHIFKKRVIKNSTPYKDGRTLYEYTFTTSYSNNSTWKVTDIKKGKHKNPDYEAWCIEEPDTHTFTLEGGIVTGNCLSVPFDDLLANGFNTRQTDVRPAQSVSTAFQLVAVIFQIQSLQQFGGVSATHLDWTMVPYVRKSFWKHYRDGITYCEEDGMNSEIFTMKDSDKDRSIEDAFWREAFPKAYKYAVDMTKKECYQAVEGMYHNLFIWATRQ